MKTLRFLGMTMIMVLFAVNFSACSDDGSDDDLDFSKLEGTWYLTASEGFEVYGEEEPERWNKTYDSPEDMINMIKIKSLGDNKFEILSYYYDEDTEKWEIHSKDPELTIFKLDGKRLISASGSKSVGYITLTILELSDTKMVLEFHVSDNEGEWYNKWTYTSKFPILGQPV